MRRKGVFAIESEGDVHPIGFDAASFYFRNGMAQRLQRSPVLGTTTFVGPRITEIDYVVCHYRWPFTMGWCQTGSSAFDSIRGFSAQHRHRPTRAPSMSQRELAV